MMRFILAMTCLLLWGPTLWASSPVMPPEPVLPIKPYLPTFKIPSHSGEIALNRKVEAWVLALPNTFQQTFQAHVLVNKLQKSGFPAYYQQIKSMTLPAVDNQALLSGYQVFIGPDIDKSRLQKMQKQLQKQYQLTSQLQTFQLSETIP